MISGVPTAVAPPFAEFCAVAASHNSNAAINTLSTLNHARMRGV
jgi:hypothetical protein